jgi:hypothetical protein
MTTRLPSFNDFSRVTLKKDLRSVLSVIESHDQNDDEIFAEWKKSLFPGWDAKRIKTNITATLGSTQLITGRPMTLSTFGRKVQAASSAKEAAKVFCTEIIRNQNGIKLIEAIKNLHQRGDRATKETLQAELQRLGVTDLANNTTDHTTLKNWMIEAGIVLEVKKGYPTINDEVLKLLTGISSAEANELRTLTLSQQVFLHLLRKMYVTLEGPFNIEVLYKECRATWPHEFASANLAKAVKEPLSDAGWIEISGKVGVGRGGKSGWVVGTEKLLAIPIESVIPNFNTTVPNDLHGKLQTPFSQIRVWLEGTDIHHGGLGLELLALRIILDLRLTPRGFRVRSKDTFYAEVDVTAEGDHLMFSRWTFQCKRIDATKNVCLGDVAKEVGIAMHMRAHVIVMVSTGGFTRDAYAYAKEMTKASHLQFVFLDGKVIKDYLEKGPAALYEHVMTNARHVMSEKLDQPIPGSDAEVNSVV